MSSPEESALNAGLVIVAMVFIGSLCQGGICEAIGYTILAIFALAFSMAIIAVLSRL